MSVSESTSVAAGSLGGEIAHARLIAELRVALRNVSEETSPKAAALLGVLRTLGDGRAIVFVETKRAARLLHAALEAEDDIAEAWAPGVIVGQSAGQPDGMSWQDAQAHVLEQFRTGARRLLVATSVLQEGVDVPVCRHVIVFEARSAASLGAVVQSRGRARATDASFVLICSSAERAAHEAVLAREDELTRVLAHQMHRALSPHDSLSGTSKSNGKGAQSDTTTAAVVTAHLVSSLQKNWSPAVAVEDAAHVVEALEVAVVHGNNVDAFAIGEALGLRAAASVSCAAADTLAGTVCTGVRGRLPTTERADVLFASAAARACAAVPPGTALLLRMLGRDDRSAAAETHRIRTTLSADRLVAGAVRSPAEFVPCAAVSGNVRAVIDASLRSLTFLFVVGAVGTPNGDLYRNGSFSDSPKGARNGAQYGDIVVRIDVDIARGTRGFATIDAGTDAALCVLPLRTAPVYYFAPAGTADVRIAPVDAFPWERATSQELFGSRGQPFLDGALSEGHTTRAALLPPGFATASALAFRFVLPDAATLLHVHDLLRSASLETVLVARVHELSASNQVSPEDVAECMENGLADDPEAQYALAVLFAQHPLMHVAPRALLARISALGIDDRADALYALCTVLCQRRPFADALDVLETHVIPSLASRRTAPVRGCVRVKQVVLTPTRTLWAPPGDIPPNRVLRAFDARHFVRVRFRDEDGRRLAAVRGPGASMAHVYARVRAAVFCGIALAQSSVRWAFLAASSSQLREHGCWFVAPHFRTVPATGVPHTDNSENSRQESVTAESIRAWCGDFRDIRVIAKHMARLGQSFSASTVAAVVGPKDVMRIPDIEIRRADGRGAFVFSDGIGRVTPALCREIAHALRRPFADGFSRVSRPFKDSSRLNDCPSPSENLAVREDAGHTSFEGDARPMPRAFQIRYAGCKGVVAMHGGDDEPRMLALRPSMEKFHSPHTDLEVLGAAEYIPCFLNRQVVLILASLGVRDEAFAALQNTHLERLAAMLFDAQECTAALAQALVNSTHVLGPMVRQACASLDTRSMQALATQPFFRSLLLARYKKQMDELLSRTRVFVPHGRVLMGVLDETGTLGADEVFVRISRQACDSWPPIDSSLAAPELREDGNARVVVGTVVVAKNPCMHPGDVRVLRAVYSAALSRCHVDVLVFPQTGERPIPNMCSGSDLDGDLYWLSWDPALVPPTVAAPMDYTGADTAATCVPPGAVVGPREMADFVSMFVSNDQLGPIANAHVAHADSKPAGVRDPLCMRLARLFALAVDFAKTGFIPALPRDARVTAWPDYMQKGEGASSYASQHIIGRLFRQVRAIVACRPHAVPETTSDPKMNAKENCEDKEAFHTIARRTYERYAEDVAAALHAHSVTSEAQVLAGAIFDDGVEECTGDIRDSLDVLRARLAAIVDAHRAALLGACATLNGTAMPPVVSSKIGNVDTEDCTFSVRSNNADGDAMVDDDAADTKVRLARACAYVVAQHPLRLGLREPVRSFAWLLPSSWSCLAEQQPEPCQAFTAQAAIGASAVRAAVRLCADAAAAEVAAVEAVRRAGRAAKLSATLVGSALAHVCTLHVSDANAAVPPGSNLIRAHGRMAAADGFRDAVLCDANTGNTIVKVLTASGVTLSHERSNETAAALSVRARIEADWRTACIIAVCVAWARAAGVARPAISTSGFATALSVAASALRVLDSVPNALGAPFADAATHNGPTANKSQRKSVSFSKVSAESAGRFASSVAAGAATATPADHEAIGSAILRVLGAFAAHGLSPQDGISVSDSSKAEVMVRADGARHALAQSLDVAELFVHTTGTAETPTQKGPRVVRSHAKLAAVFVEGCSLVLFPGADADTPVDFALYEGPRRPHHNSVQCFVPRVHVSASENAALYDAFYGHAFRQLSLLRDTAPEGASARLAVRPGRFYVTRLPRLFVEDKASAVVSTVQRALGLGQKTLNASQSASIIAGRCDAVADNEEAPDEDDTAVDPDALENAAASRLEPVGPQGAPRKKKRSLTAMTSAFDPELQGLRADVRLENELIGAGFVPSRDSSSVVVALPISAFTDAERGGSASFARSDECQAMYTADSLALKRLTVGQVRWLSVDIAHGARVHGDDAVGGGRFASAGDARIITSTRTVIEDPADPAFAAAVQKGCVVERVLGEDGALRLRVCEPFRSVPQMLVREVHTRSYTPSAGDTADETLRVDIMHVTEYTMHNGSTGNFAHVRAKTEAAAVLTVPAAQIDPSRVIPLAWRLAALFQTVADSA